MNQPGNVIATQATEPDSSWWHNPLAEWLLTAGWHLGDPAELTRGFADLLIAHGYPLLRMRITIRMLHPQVVGVSYTWDKDQEEISVYEPLHSILQTDEYLNSPYAALFEGAGGMRQRLDLPEIELKFPILTELRDRGATDYVAMPFSFSNGQLNAVTFAADRVGGFSNEELGRIYELLPALSRVFERHAVQRMARTLLETYLGAHSGSRVMDGLVKRGDGEDIYAVIWFCDLRDSTPLADGMPRAEFLATLNDYFDCMAGAVLAHDGEVLRFIGDAVLAIFPIDSIRETPGFVAREPRRCAVHRRVCRAAVAAARDAAARIDALNVTRRDQGKAPLHFGIGLHLGEVTYGNIGVPERLEFTVIGAAANETARLEGECKRLQRPILASEEFARVVPDAWTSLGRHELRGISRSREIFALRD